MKRVYVGIDASNLAMSETGGRAELHRLISAINQVKEVFEQHDLHLQVFADASLKWKFPPGDQSTYIKMVEAGEIIQVPAGTEADSWLLRWAEENDALIISNDLFRKYEAAFPWLTETDSGRIVTGLFNKGSRRWTFIERRTTSVARDLFEMAGVVRQKSVPGKDRETLYDEIFEPKQLDGVTLQYRARVDEENPTAFLFLVDQSGSMSEMWDDRVQKSNQVASTINEMLFAIRLRSTKGRVRDLFDVGVIGYGGLPIGGIRSLLKGTTLERPFLSTSELATSVTELVFRENGQERRVRRWIEPRAEGGTPMKAAIDHATRVIKEWTLTHEASFPPIVFNITDGQSTDGEIPESANRLCDVRTADGNTMLWTAHISSGSDPKIAFPALLPSNSVVPARKMFDASSVMPTEMRKIASGLGIQVPSGGRAFLYNASPIDVVNFLDIGTRGTRIA